MTSINFDYVFTGSRTPDTLPYPPFPQIPHQNSWSGDQGINGVHHHGDSVDPSPHFAADGPNGHGTPTRKTKARAKKRKAEDMEQRSGKRLVDTYSKRSKTLIEKATELEKLSGAYVVMYAARPESIGAGRSRLYISDSLRNIDPTLAQRLTKATDEINSVAIECARRSGMEVRQGVKMRADTILEDTNGCERAANSAITAEANRNAILAHTRAPRLSFIPFEFQHSVPGDCSHQEHPSVMSSTAASHLPPHISFASWASVSIPAACCSMEKSEVISLVNRLMNNSKDIQLSALNDIKKLVLSDHGMQLICDHMAIPRLVELSDPTFRSGIDVASLSLGILFRLSLYQKPCIEMVKAGVIHTLRCFLSHPASSDGILASAAETMGHCAIQHCHVLDTSCLFTRDILTPLINLLYCNEEALVLSALNAIANIALSGIEASKKLWDDDIIPELCHLASKIPSLAVLERLALAIGRIVHENVVDRKGHFASIEKLILRPLLSLLGHENAAVQIRACRALLWLSESIPLLLDFRTVVVSSLIPLLSEENDEVFAEAISAALPWTYKMEDDTWDSYKNKTIGDDEGSHFNIEMVRRLVNFLSYCNDSLAACTARAIGQFAGFCHLSCDEVSDVMDELGGTKQIIGLLYSDNPIVARQTARSIYELTPFVFGSLVDHGVISALFRSIERGFHSYAILEGSLEAIGFITLCLDEEEVVAFIRADAIPCTLRIIALSTKISRLCRDLPIITVLKFLCASPIARDALLEKGVVPFIQTVKKSGNDLCMKYAAEALDLLRSEAERS